MNNKFCMYLIRKKSKKKIIRNRKVEFYRKTKLNGNGFRKWLKCMKVTKMNCYKNNTY